MIASYRVCHVLVKYRKSFQDGKMVKESFIEAADSLFETFKNKNEIMSAIKDLQLSKSTVTKRFEGMEENLTAKLERVIGRYECFSIQFVKSIDSVDIAQLCVFIRMVLNNMTVKEELPSILSLKGPTLGKDILQAFMNYAYKTKLPLSSSFPLQLMGHPLWWAIVTDLLLSANRITLFQILSIIIVSPSTGFMWRSIK